jgi:hypothetical protein
MLLIAIGIWRAPGGNASDVAMSLLASGKTPRKWGVRRVFRPMYYWILRSPPGLPQVKPYMVSPYRTPDPASYVRTKRQLFAGSLEEARALIPKPASSVQCEPFNQFVELWKSEGSDEEAMGGA